MLKKENKFPCTGPLLPLFNGCKLDKEELIRGMMYEGDSLIVCGDKANKTFMLMHLAQAIAVGGTWMKSKCIRSDVLYVMNRSMNDKKLHRIEHNIYLATGSYDKKMANYVTLRPNYKNITVDEFLDVIITCAKDMDSHTMKKGQRHLAIIIDSIDGIGLRSLPNFLKKYKEAFDGNAPSLIVGTTELWSEAHLCDSVVFIEKYFPSKFQDRVISDFRLKYFPNRESMIGKFTYPLFNWKQMNGGDEYEEPEKNS